MAQSNTPPPEFLVWVQTAENAGPSDQPPADELIAEHYLMARVLAAMETEGQHMQAGTRMRTEFWAEVLDFVANFVSMCHRIKEERDFFAALGPTDPDPAHSSRLAAVEEEHRQAQQLTEDFCDALATKEWDAMARLVEEYISFMRPHMIFEETHLVRPAQKNPDEQINTRLRHFFDEREAHALAGKSRKYYLDLTRRLCEEAGIDPGLE